MLSLPHSYTYTQVRPSGKSLWMMWPSCELQLSSPGKKYVHGARNTFHSLHAKIQQQSVTYQLIECSQLYMYTQPP